MNCLKLSGFIFLTFILSVSLVYYQELVVEDTETTSVSPVPNLVELGALPVKCGLRMVDDNPMDPLGQPKIVKGEPTKPGAYPWQVTQKECFI